MMTNTPLPRRLKRVLGAVTLLAALMVALLPLRPAAAQEPTTVGDDPAARIHLPIVARSHTAGSPEPGDGAANVSPNAWLAWRSSLPPELVPGYRWSVYLDPGVVYPTTLIANDLQRGWIDPSTFTPGGAYSWRVLGIASDGVSDPIPGPVWRFTVESADRPATDAAIAAMITVPAGEFKMGCDPSNTGGYDCRPREVPLHTVYLDTYR
ncbi:MAG: hypothetical protein ACRC1H_07230, partial [Caldilineaceae bacterium]